MRSEAMGMTLSSSFLPLYVHLFSKILQDDEYILMLGGLRSLTQEVISFR